MSRSLFRRKYAKRFHKLGEDLYFWKEARPVMVLSKEMVKLILPILPS